MRRGECCALKWEDINYAERRIHVCRNAVKTTGGEIIVKAPKTKAGNRYVYLSLIHISHGSIMQMKPAAISKMPTARTQPQPRTPSACRSNALTNREMPENISQTVKRNGSDNSVNHWLNSRNSDMITVSYTHLV